MQIQGDGGVEFRIAWLVGIYNLHYLFLFSKLYSIIVLTESYRQVGFTMVLLYEAYEYSFVIYFSHIMDYCKIFEDILKLMHWLCLLVLVELKHNFSTFEECYTFFFWKINVLKLILCLCWLYWCMKLNQGLSASSSSNFDPMLN